MDPLNILLWILVILAAFITAPIIITFLVGVLLVIVAFFATIGELFTRLYNKATKKTPNYRR